MFYLLSYDCYVSQRPKFKATSIFWKMEGIWDNCPSDNIKIKVYASYYYIVPFLIFPCMFKKIFSNRWR